MYMAAVRIREHAGDAIGRYPGRIEELGVGGARFKRRNHRHAGPQLIRHSFYRFEYALG